MRGLVFLIALHWPNDHPRGDRWFGIDKAKHFATAAFVQSVSFSSLRLTGLSRQQSLIGATAVTTSLSIGKEVVDRRRGGPFSAKDLTWDALGMGTASILLNQTGR